MENASLIKRFCAYLIDLVFIYLAVLLLSILFRVLHDIDYIFMIADAYSFTYFLYCYVRNNGKTIGAEILKIKVVGVDGEKPSLLNLIIRSGIKTIYVGPLGISVVIAGYFAFLSIILLLISPTKEKKRTILDFVGKTWVVKSE